MAHSNGSSDSSMARNSDSNNHGSSHSSNHDSSHSNRGNNRNSNRGSNRGSNHSSISYYCSPFYQSHVEPLYRSWVARPRGQLQWHLAWEWPVWLPLLCICSCFSSHPRCFEHLCISWVCRFDSCIHISLVDLCLCMVVLFPCIDFSYLLLYISCFPGKSCYIFENI